MPIAPISSVQSFTNNSAETQGIKRNPYVASQTLQKASALAPSTADAGARVQALQAKAGEINAWSSRMTGYKQQGRLVRELEKARQAQAAAKAQAEAAAAQQAAQGSRGGNGRSAGGALGGAVRSSGANNNAPLTAASGNGVRSQIIRNAQAMIGIPYAWGGGGIGNRSSRGIGLGTQNVIGVDCSGLTSYVYGLIGVNLPRKSDSQLTRGVKTSIANAQPGDLIGWGPGGHVAIYAGNNMIIESPKPGAHVRTRALGSYDSGRGVYAVRLRLPGE